MFWLHKYAFSTPENPKTREEFEERLQELHKEYPEHKESDENPLEED